jgi:hypothetical protein
MTNSPLSESFTAGLASFQKTQNKKKKDLIPNMMIK